MTIRLVRGALLVLLNLRSVLSNSSVLAFLSVVSVVPIGEAGGVQLSEEVEEELKELLVGQSAAPLRVLRKFSSGLTGGESGKPSKPDVGRLVECR